MSKLHPIFEEIVNSLGLRHSEVTPDEMMDCYQFGDVPAQGIETRSATDAKRRGPKGESPVRRMRPNPIRRSIP